ncbi:MAG TPA: glycosyltransferase [Thermoanaerobaculia bacterium]|jgi:glycosyltransferase involved in cell wall biosynthesis
MRILQVSTRDVAGGAERSARNLADAYRELGHESWLAVGEKREGDPFTIEIPNDRHRGAFVRGVDALRRTPLVRRVRGAGRATSLLRAAAEPSRVVARELGHEDFDYPATAHLLELTPAPPDILHLHNLHGGYFDLRELPRLSHRVPTVLNVRDAWLMTGHCAFPLDGNERWKSGCGDCPDLNIFPAIKRDGTAFNWQRKRRILAASRLYVATPSEWMMSLVRESIVAPAAVETRVVPNGVDTRVFRPGDRAVARAAIGVAPDVPMLLVAANGIRQNIWKDYVTLRAALTIVGEAVPNTVVIAVGENAPPERLGSLELRFVPFESDSSRLADYYRAADVYVHAARVESFGNVLLEARACGTPIVSTATGGIPEQVPEGTGVLVPPFAPQALAMRTIELLRDAPLRARIAAAGMEHVHKNLSLRVQAERFLAWYAEILDREARHAAG